MAATAEPREERAAPKGAASSGLDTMLTDAARGPLRRWCPAAPRSKLAARLADAARTGGHARRSARRPSWRRSRIGRSEVEPSKGDRRFKDEAWRGNPAFRRLLQSYLAAGQAVDGLIGDAGLDWRSERRVRFAAENVLDALAPSNAPLTNPAVLKATLDTGGRNFVRGAANFARDMSQAAADPVDGRHVRVHGRRGPRRHARRGRAAHPGVRAHPVRAADREGARARRCCSCRR